MAPPVRASVGLLGLPALAFLLWVAAFRPGGPSTSNTRLYLTYGSAAFALAGAALLASAVLAPGAPLSRLLATRPLVEIGKRSYGLYLWHYPVWVAVSVELDGLGINARRLIVVVASAGMTVLSYRFVEQPALRWKRRFERGGAGPISRSDVVEVAPRG
jgi:peptidoglycan/LPS O-acetylase OafA/YrhL